jgi:hypothetical protein
MITVSLSVVKNRKLREEMHRNIRAVGGFYLCPGLGLR